MRQFFKLLKYVKPYWKSAVLNILFNVSSAVFALFSFTLAAPFLKVLFGTQSMVMESVPFELSKESILANINYGLSHIILTQGKAGALLIVSILVVLITLLKTGTLFLANYFITTVRTGVEKDIRTNIYSKILKLPLSYYNEARKGDVISRISTDVKEIETSIMSSLEMLFRDPFTVILFLSSMFLLSYKLTLVVLILLPLGGILIGRLGKKLRTTSFKGQVKMGFLLSVIEETLSGLRIIKAFNAEEHFSDKFRNVNVTYTRILNKVYRRRYLASPLSEFLGTLIMMILMYYGGSLVLSGKAGLSSAMFITYIIIFSQVINPAKSISGAFFNVQKGMASMDRINQILEEEESILEIPDAKPIQEFKKSIEYGQVSFRYNSKDLVLKDINLKINKGQTIALVGQSGGGKSTLADLLPRFIDATSGEILIDGIPVNQYKIFDLRNLMGIVNQEPILFNDTYFNNIAFGLEHIDEEDVIAAAKVANAHEFIIESPDGYETSIGERGGKLSGGQRQRISIARALLKNPPILILDEATSSLDTQSERLVQDAIIKLMKNRTSIVIAHRLSTIKNADEICVINDGQIVERGKHKKLLEMDGYYARLHRMQVYD